MTIPTSYQPEQCQQLVPHLKKLPAKLLTGGQYVWNIRDANTQNSVTFFLPDAAGGWESLEWHFHSRAARPDVEGWCYRIQPEMHENGTIARAEEYLVAVPDARVSGWVANLRKPADEKVPILVSQIEGGVNMYCVRWAINSLNGSLRIAWCEV